MCVCFSWRLCYFKGWSLRCSPGRGNAGRFAVTLYVGEGPSGSNGSCLTLLRLSIFHSDTHNQTGPLWCWFPSKCACAHSRPLWVSPTTSPVRLGVSPVAAPTPTGVSNQRFEALFPRAGALGYAVYFAPPQFLPVYLCANVGLRGATRCSAWPVSATLSLALLVYLCVNVGPQGLLVVRLPAPFVPHSASLSPATAMRVLSAPVPVSAPPTSLDVCLFLSPWCRTSLPLDFLSVLVVREGAVCLPTPPSWFS